MINAQNEIKYRIAWGMMKKLYEQGLLTTEEFNIMHNVVLQRYCPVTVHQLP